MPMNPAMVGYGGTPMMQNMMPSMPMMQPMQRKHPADVVLLW